MSGYFSKASAAPNTTLALHSVPPGKEAVESPRTDEECVAVLEQHRLDCENEGKYGDAENARLRIQSLCSAEQDHRREQLRTQQFSERMAMEEAHMKELEDFNYTWDVQKKQEFDAHAQQLPAMLGERNHAEHFAFVEKLRAETEPRTPRWSAGLLRLRKVHQTLGKQKNYPEAGAVKEEADALEAKEHLVWQRTRDKKIAVFEEQFLHKQRMEMCGLNKRIESGRTEQAQARKTELNRILQRYINVKMQLESQQKTIMVRLDKYPVSAKDLLAKVNPDMVSPNVSIGAIGA